MAQTQYPVIDTSAAKGPFFSLPRLLSMNFEAALSAPWANRMLGPVLNVFHAEYPDRLLVKPVDPWPGNAAAGQMLFDGAFMMGSGEMILRPDSWDVQDAGDVWAAHIHGFTWLRDLRALGGERARSFARLMIQRWIETHGTKPRRADLHWCADVTAQRLSMWISHYEFFSSASDEIFQDLFFAAAFRQAKMLHKFAISDKALYGLGALQTCKGLLYAGLAFEGYERWVEDALSRALAEIEEQILPDGSHISRSPSQLLNALEILIDMRGALASGGHPLPPGIQHAIDRIGPALRLFCYADKQFGLFAGAQMGDAEHIERALAQSGARSKPLSSLPCAGYERLSLGRSLIVFDSGKVPPAPHDAAAHVAPLSFEMNYGKDRIFVACGSHPLCGDWQESLRATAAQNTLIIGNRNACEINRNGHITRRIKHAKVFREDTPESCFIEASHDGYEPLFGVTHTRRLFLGDQGHDLRGEDVLASEKNIKPQEFAIRFHLHPRILASLTLDGAAALLRVPSGIGWRFQQEGGRLALEDSIFLGEGCKPRKTRQLVIYGQTDKTGAQVKWALHREGL
jgi:uncharacterized heparinase superfamily protein